VEVVGSMIDPDSSTEDIMAALAAQAADVGRLRAEVESMQTIAHETTQAINANQQEQQDFSFDDGVDDSGDDLVAVSPTPRPVEMPPFGQQVAQPFNPHALAEEGIALAVANLPDWHRTADAVLERASGNPALQRAFDSGQPANVAAVLASIKTTVDQQASSRAMKLNAQSAVGASGRPEPASDDAAAWANIVNAGDSGYASTRKSW
jgi:hypothetical protein